MVIVAGNKSFLSPFLASGYMLVIFRSRSCYEARNGWRGMSAITIEQLPILLRRQEREEITITITRIKVGEGKREECSISIEL